MWGLYAPIPNDNFINTYEVENPFAQLRQNSNNISLRPVHLAIEKKQSPQAKTSILRKHSSPYEIPPLQTKTSTIYTTQNDTESSRGRCILQRQFDRVEYMI
jgi:hypothetical protein